MDLKLKFQLKENKDLEQLICDGLELIKKSCYQNLLMVQFLKKIS